MKPNNLTQFLKLFVFALITALGCLSTGYLVSAANAGEAGVMAGGGVAGGDMGAYKLAPGDRITVTVFNQRDLSGDFLIDGGGNIHLPLIGAVPVGQTTIDACQRRLTERLADGLLNNPRVSVRVSEFRPILVHGVVRVPGSYPFRFGLSAIGAIALAGGAGMSDVRQGVAMGELLASEERLKVLDTTRLSLSVRLARMEAERLGKNTFEVRDTSNGTMRRDASLTQPTRDGLVQIDALMREEQEELVGRQEGHEQTIELIKQQKPKVQKEIEAIKEAIANETHIRQLSQARLNEYSQLAKRGLVRAATELEMQRQVALHEAKISELKGKLARLDVGLGDLDIRVQETENTRRLVVTTELRDTRTRLREIEASLPAIRELIELRQQQVGLVSTGSLEHSYWILLTRGGATPRVIDGTTLLEPGDIVEVRRRPPDFGDTRAEVSCDKAGEGRPCADRSAMYFRQPSN
jgi:polysaccharide export outer membrane protein